MRRGTGAPDAVAEARDSLVVCISPFAEKVAQIRPFRLTGCGESAKLTATSREQTFLGGNTMNAIATKFQVGAAALALGATAAFVPVAANAAPAVEVPAAPVQVMGDLAQAPGDFIWFFQVSSLQISAAAVRTTTFWTDLTIGIYEAKLEANPDSIFAPFYERRLEQLAEQRAAIGAITFSACRDGEGYVAGPYGTVTQGAC